MVLYFLRGAFILLAASVTALYVLPFQQESKASFGITASMIGLTIGIAGVIVAMDIFIRQKRLSALAGVFLGLIGGLVVAWALGLIVDLIGVLFGEVMPDPDRKAFLDLLRGIKVLIGLITCYLGTSLVIQTKDDFRFVIPYVEFAKEIRGNRPVLLDTSVIVDGRILDVVGTQVIQSAMIVPRFVLNELQTIADAHDKLRRARGRRGLDILQKLQENPIIDVVIDDTDVEGATVDQKLIALSERLRARLMTNDYNLSKVASLRSVEVININDLAKALRPVVLPGETMSVQLIKPGEGPGQGIGYLEDGTMIVVENGKAHLNQEVTLVVTSSLQTSAGRMIFGNCEGSTEPAPPAEPLTDTESPAEQDAASKPNVQPSVPPERDRAPTATGSGAALSRRNPRRR